eukprot:5542290-Alexandrium_andersonii.AAC.1
MGVGARQPEPANADPDAQELQAVFAVLQRVLRPGKGKGTGSNGALPQPPAGLRLRVAPRVRGKALSKDA